MDFETVVLTKENYVATLMLNRPDRANAVNRQMMEELIVALDDVGRDDDLRVLVLTGAGRMFCGGGDVADEDMYLSMDMEQTRKWIRRSVQGVTERIYNLPIPSIAMINGVAVGGGFDWACACDIRIGSNKARFMSAQVRTAVVPDSGSCFLLPRLVGLGKALEILYTGDWIEAEEAVKIGLLNKMVPAADLEKETMSLVDKIAKGPPIVLRFVKQLAYKGLDSDLAASLEMTATSTAVTMATEDRKEGIAAWKEKREAVYKGK